MNFYKNNVIITPEQDELKEKRGDHGYRIFCHCGSCNDGRKERGEIGPLELYDKEKLDKLND